MSTKSSLFYNGLTGSHIWHETNSPSECGSSYDIEGIIDWKDCDAEIVGITITVKVKSKYVILYLSDFTELSFDYDGLSFTIKGASPSEQVFTSFLSSL